MDDHVLTKGDTSSLFKSALSRHHSVFWVYSVHAVNTWQQVQKCLSCDVSRNTVCDAADIGFSCGQLPRSS